MPAAASSVLGAWSSFYVIIGSSAAALTGLMFVVITLVAGQERARRTPAGIAAFGTPTVAHFCVALLSSAILSAPWRSLVHTGAMVGVTGLYGGVHVLRGIYQTRRQTAYRPQLEDWIWYTILPLIAYSAIVAGAIRLPAIPAKALFALAGGVVLLIFIGIRNAWDIVTFLALGQMDDPPVSSPKSVE